MYTRASEQRQSGSRGVRDRTAKRCSEGRHVPTAKPQEHTPARFTKQNSHKVKDRGIAARRRCIARVGYEKNKNERLVCEKKEDKWSSADGICPRPPDFTHRRSRRQHERDADGTGGEPFCLTAGVNFCTLPGSTTTPTTKQGRGQGSYTR